MTPLDLLVHGDLIFDPASRWMFYVSESFSSARRSPYAGRELLGRVRATYLRGRPVYSDGELLAGPGSGRWLPRPRSVPASAPVGAATA